MSRFGETKIAKEKFHAAKKPLNITFGMLMLKI